MKMVSIIIPAFNSEKYIRESVDSALGQIYKNIEVIVVDDGSTDNTKKVLEPYIVRNKIRYIYQKNNGLSAARNLGIKAAKGEFIAFLDADDIFLPEKVRKQIEYLENNPKCDMNYCGIYHFYENKPQNFFKLNYKYFSGNEVFKELLWKNFINPLSVVFKRETIEKYGMFDETFRRTEDWEYWVRLAWQGAKFCFLPDILAKYRINRKSMTYEKSGVLQRQKEVEIFVNLKQKMSAEKRKKYKINAVIWHHRLKLIYAYLADYFSVFKKIQLWLRAKRLKTVVVD